MTSHPCTLCRGRGPLYLRVGWACPRCNGKGRLTVFAVTPWREATPLLTATHQPQ
jgi:DnaJ-class molecular chaperone